MIKCCKEGASPFLDATAQDKVAILGMRMYAPGTDSLGGSGFLGSKVKSAFLHRLNKSWL